MSNGKEKARNLTEKFKKMEEQVARNAQNRQIYQLKHREIETLKKEDNYENQISVQKQRFIENCKTVEKHLALSILNKEKKNYMMN